MLIDVVSNKIRVLLSFLICFSLLLPQAFLSAHKSTPALELDRERHLVLNVAVTDQTIHTHDNGTFEETSLNHQHGHNSADHSHSGDNLTTCTNCVASKNGIWDFNFTRDHLSHVPVPWMRPPRSTYFS